MIQPGRRHLHALVVATAAALLVAASAPAEPAPITAKRTQAAAVLAQVRAIDSKVARAAEAYNLATIKLDRIRSDQRENAELLQVASANLRGARAVLEARLVALYTSGESSTPALEVLLGATSLDDFLNRLETIDSISEQDAEVLRDVSTFRAQVERRRRALERARREQAAVVAERAAQRAAVERQLRERQSLLASIRSEIARMEAAERARQARLVREAQAQLAELQVERSPAVEEASIGVAAETPEAAVAPPARHGGVVGIAMGYLGTPYRWGGSSPSTGFDCSGFTMYVFAQVGVSLPHYTGAQWNMGTPVSRDQLQPGDLVFFNNLGHMGIYVGGGNFIHSPHTGDVVKISSLSDSWYARTYMGARRL